MFRRVFCFSIFNVGALAALPAASAALGQSGDLAPPDPTTLPQGSIVGWGSQVVGVDLSQGFIAVAAGSSHSLGLKADGSIVAWGDNYYGQTDVPAPNTGFVAVAAGGSHSLGLKADGSIVAWGYNYPGQTDVPAPNTGFVAVAAGWYHSLGLKADGSIVAWGSNGSGQTNVPAPNTDFIAVAAGSAHSLGLKADGSIVAWGANGYGQTDVPAPNTGFVAVAAGRYHSLGLKAGGSIVAWGYNYYGQTNVPAPNTGFVAVAAGSYHSLAIRGDLSAPHLAVSPSVRNVAAASGVTSFAVSNTGGGSMSWTAEVIQGGDWLRITSGSSAVNSGTISLEFDANESADSRTGTVRVSAPEAIPSVVDVQVVQVGSGACPRADRAGLVARVVEVNHLGQVVGPLPMAEVQLTGIGPRSSDGQGEVRFCDLAPGDYGITVSKSGHVEQTRPLSLSSGQLRNELFQLVREPDAPPPGDEAGTPGRIDFASARGRHFVEKMPGDLAFEATVAWNGSPGTVDFVLGSQRFPAALADLGGGKARASVSIPAPSVISSCSELRMEATNAEGKRAHIGTGVYFHPMPAILPHWISNLVEWIPTGTGYYASYSLSVQHKLDVPPGVYSNSWNYALDTELLFDPVAGSGRGKLSGSGSYRHTVALPQAEHIGEIGFGASGSLAISLSECNPPLVTPSWSASLSGKAGVGAPAVRFADVLVTGAGQALSKFPVLRDVMLHAFVLVDLALSGEYVPGASSTCFLGSSSIDLEQTVGLEGRVALAKFGVEGRIYLGGTGALDIGICPNLLELEGGEVKLYIGAFVSAWMFEFSAEFGRTLTFVRSGEQTFLLPFVLHEDLEAIEWRPIGHEPLRWGPMNRLAADAERVIAFGLGMDEPVDGVIEVVLVENVIRLSAPALFVDDSETVVLFALHDPEKPWHAVTDIAQLRREGIAEWTLDRVVDDVTADFSPAIVKVDDSRLLAVWERVSGDVSEAKEPQDVDPYVEIAAAWFDTETGLWSSTQDLTENSVLDRNPHPVVPGGTPGVLWVQEWMIETEEEDRLMFSAWGGSDWEAPTVLWSGGGRIMTFTFATDAAGEGYLVFAVDEDRDEVTTDDRDLYLIEHVEGEWKPAIRLTENAFEDSLPVLVAPDGAPMLVWNADGRVFYTHIDLWDPREAFSESPLASEVPTLDGVTMPGGAAVAYTMQTENGVSIVAGFYDASLDRWSSPRTLTDDQHVDTSLSLAWDGSALLAAYLKTQTVREDVEVEIEGKMETIENVPLPGRTDLYLLRYFLGHDLAIAEGSVTLEPGNPAPGSNAAVSAMVENRGDMSAEFVVVAFYDGDPEGDRLFIEDVVLDELHSGQAEEVCVVWEVPLEARPREVFAVVDFVLEQDDRDRSNNIGSVQSVLPDLAGESAWSDEVSPTTVQLVARIVNQGVIPTGAFDVSWHLGALEGEEIGIVTVDTIEAGALHEVEFLWDLEGYGQSGDALHVFVIADALDVIVEFDETNNTHVHGLTIPVRVFGDYNGDGLVDLQDVSGLVATLSGPSVEPAVPGWQVFDFDGNGLVDLLDVQMFQIEFSPVE